MGGIEWRYHREERSALPAPRHSAGTARRTWAWSGSGTGGGWFDVGLGGVPDSSGG